MESPLPMRLTRKIECLKRQKKSATKYPATHESGKYELLQELGQGELLTPDGNAPCKSSAPALVLGTRALLRGLRLSLIIGQARGRKGWDGKTSTAPSWGNPKDFHPHCNSTGSSQPTHRNHQPGLTWAYDHFIGTEGCYIYVSGILPSMWRKKPNKLKQITTHL